MPAEGATVHEKYVNSLFKIVDEVNIEGVERSDCVEIVKINNPSQPGVSNTVLVKMSSERARDNLLYQRKKLKDCSTKCFFNEDLTKYDSQIFKRLRQEVKSGRIHSCWSKNGLCWAKSTAEGKPYPVHE
jgi:hypothetical protein